MYWAEQVEKPLLQEILRCSPDRIPHFIDEVLRLQSPFAGHFRKVVPAGGVTLHGVHMPQHARVQVLWASANRDPKVPLAICTPPPVY
jgi:cytochrome P450